MALASKKYIRLLGNSVLTPFFRAELIIIHVGKIRWVRILFGIIVAMNLSITGTGSKIDAGLLLLLPLLRKL